MRTRSTLVLDGARRRRRSWRATALQARRRRRRAPAPAATPRRRRSPRRAGWPRRAASSTYPGAEVQRRRERGGRIVARAVVEGADGARGRRSWPSSTPTSCAPPSPRPRPASRGRGRGAAGRAEPRAPASAGRGADRGRARPRPGRARPRHRARPAWRRRRAEIEPLRGAAPEDAHRGAHRGHGDRAARGPGRDGRDRRPRGHARRPRAGCASRARPTRPTPARSRVGRRGRDHRGRLPRPGLGRAAIEEIADSVTLRALKPQDPGRPTDTRILAVKVAFAETTPLRARHHRRAEDRRPRR